MARCSKLAPVKIWGDAFYICSFPVGATLVVALAVEVRNF